MVMVSGVLYTDFTGLAELRGVGFGLAAAVLYACVMILNKKIQGIGPYDKTIAQLTLAVMVMLPYVLLTQNLSTLTYTFLSSVLLAVAGILHTGIAYWLYFSSMGSLKAQTVALYSYIDPILAIILGMVVFHEPMSIPATIGAVLILGAAFISEQ